jgi:RNA polymerase sigma-54 factor
VQGLEPAGVGARDLRECLLLQIADRGGPPLARRLVEDCLVDVEAGRLSKAARRLRVPLSRVRAAAKVILALDRAPGLSVSAPATQALTPDAAIERDGAGWRVALERGGIPRLAVSRGYARRSRETSDTETRVYLAKSLQDAERLLAALHERDRILRRILEAVVQDQRAFLKRGPSAISPVYMKDVAKTTSLPVKTVARAIEGKAVRTPYGVMPIRSLFASGDRHRPRRASTKGRA